MKLGRLQAAGHDDFTGADGFHDVELAEQADGGIELVGVSSDESDEAVFLQIDGLTVVMLDDLQDLGALCGTGGDFDEDEFFGNGVTIGVLDAMNDVDELIHLHDDLVQAFWMTADANGHAAEAWITSLGDDQRLNVKSATAKDSADAAEDTRLVVHHDAERVDVDDFSLWSWLDIGGGGDAVAHGMDDLRWLIEGFGEKVEVGGQAFLSHLDVVGIFFDAEPTAAQTLGSCGSGT